MDVGFYLGELLMQQGEVNVPGLGYFVQASMSGYYDEAEGTFYPPYHQAQFDVQSIDDDALAEYIAEKKKISIASARYFSEKYITSLKQEALVREVPIGNLGWFYTELTQLTFRPADKIIDDTIYYGFEGIKIKKVGRHDLVDDRPKVEPDFVLKLLKPQVTEEIPAEEPAGREIIPQPVYEEDEVVAESISPEFFETDEEEEVTSPIRTALIILGIVVILGLGAFALYRYKPAMFEKMVFWKHKTVVTDSVKAKPVAIVDTTFNDSVKTDSAKVATDTLAKIPVITAKTEVITTQPVTPPNKTVTTTKKTEVITTQAAPPPAKTVVTTTKPPIVVSTTTISTIPKAEPSLTIPMSTAAGTRRFEVYAAKGRDMAEVRLAISRLQKLGFDARYVPDAPGVLKRVSVGHFKTFEEAHELAKKAGEKAWEDVYPLEIIPQ